MVSPVQMVARSKDVSRGENGWGAAFSALIGAATILRASGAGSLDCVPGSERAPSVSALLKTLEMQDTLQKWQGRFDSPARACKIAVERLLEISRHPIPDEITHLGRCSV